MGPVLNRANRSINRAALERLALGGGESVLEVGFGGGAALATILSRTSGPVVGIEVSEAMLRHAGRRFHRQLEHGHLQLRHGSVTAIPYEDDTFDRALAVQTIYFWPDPAAGLRELHRTLKPGGRLVVATEAREDMEQRSYARHGFALFDRTVLCAMLEQAGFTQVIAERTCRYVFPTGRSCGYVFTSGRKSGSASCKGGG
jgi:ubiquinone/menaquinone biosynthesis C-methylase UbiE